MTIEILNIQNKTTIHRLDPESVYCLLSYLAGLQVTYEYTNSILASKDLIGFLSHFECIGLSLFSIAVCICLY